jgi:hypothetical protein
MKSWHFDIKPLIIINSIHISEHSALLGQGYLSYSVGLWSEEKLTKLSKQASP